jgi:hypothetical protein
LSSYGKEEKKLKEQLYFCSDPAWIELGLAFDIKDIGQFHTIYF